MHRTLIIARLDPADTGAVANIFAESDATDLPRMIGVTRRTLFRFHDLYLHLVEADADIAPALGKARSHPLYADINTKLARYMKPYDPGWAKPSDAFAVPFYSWTP